MVADAAPHGHRQSPTLLRDLFEATRLDKVLTKNETRLGRAVTYPSAYVDVRGALWRAPAKKELDGRGQAWPRRGQAGTGGYRPNTSDRSWAQGGLASCWQAGIAAG